VPKRCLAPAPQLAEREAAPLHLLFWCPRNQIEEDFGKKNEMREVSGARLRFGNRAEDSCWDVSPP